MLIFAVHDSEVMFWLIMAIVGIIIGIANSAKDDPRNTAAGRWGIKTRKFISGDFGGEEWGERRKD